MYKTILVHVDETAACGQRIDVAARLAVLHDGHLVGLAATGMPPYLFPAGGLDPGVPAITFPIEQLRADADRALDGFDNRVRQAGLTSCERRCMDEEPGQAISMQARCADLVVIGQAAASDSLPRLRADVPGYVLLNCARPVLVVPAAGIRGELGRRVIVAWNGSVDAVRAITSAIPLLRLADQATLVVLNAQTDTCLHGQEPGADMALYLARHGVRVTVMAADTGTDIGGALLSRAADDGADLIVMGAYGHSRVREIMLGGATRTVLRSSLVPLWMAH